MGASAGGHGPSTLSPKLRSGPWWPLVHARLTVHAPLRMYMFARVQEVAVLAPDVDDGLALSQALEALLNAM